MKKEEQKDKHKGPGNEDYDVNHPQHIAQPSFRSDSKFRDSSGNPSTENLNLENDHNDQLKAADMASLQEDTPKTDLGNNTKKDDDKEDEQLIKK
ncbi:hypothetical protein [Pedobacter sp.]|uniref:hypothetical protein n=1 Tax=Pedobacter sp. TaxID=1411316 RepID=UPI003D7F1D55